MAELDDRDEFPVTRNWAFLNHAAVAPLSRRAHDRILAWADDYAANGAVHEGAWWREIESIRALAARLLNADPTEIAFTKNTSEGLAFVSEGFPWQPGDNLVIAEGEYPSNVYPWMHLESRGVAVRTVPARGPRIEVADLEAAMDRRTRLLSISHVQFGTGFRSDLVRLGELCQRRGIDFCVDAIQSFGALPIDVDAMRIDYLSADGHKWLVAPEGAGIFYVRRSKLDKLRPISVGWKSVIGMLDYSTIDFRLKPDAARFEAGSYNMPGILGLGASLGLLAEIGIEQIEQRVRRITDYLVERLASIGIEPFSSRAEGEWSGIVSFAVRGELAAIAAGCRERKIVVARRAGRIRASPHFYNNQDDIDRLIAALGELQSD